MTDNLIYIAGPMAGKENYNSDAFNEREKILLQQGYKVINPAAIGVAMRLNCKDIPTSEFMRMDISYLINCSHIFMMKGWRDSKGASLEHEIARALDMSIIYEGK